MCALRFVIFGCLCCVEAVALYNGNPSLPMMPENGFFIRPDVVIGAKIGYVGDYTYEMPLKIRAHGPSAKSTRCYRALANLGLLTFNLGDRAELFGTLGTQDSTLEGARVEGMPLSYVAPTSLSWGLGGRAIVAYWGDLQFAVSASYLKSLPSLSSFRVGGLLYSTHCIDANVRNWQLGLGTSYRFRLFVPYAGVSYTQFKTTLSRLRHLDLPIPLHSLSFKNRNPFGLFVGIGLGLKQGFDLNLETRLFSGYGVSASADVKF